MKIPRLQDMRNVISHLTPGQQDVVNALIGGRRAVTYRQAADALGVNVGTIYTHLRRVRERFPETYAAIMRVRGLQLAQRHVEALKRAEAHSNAWHRKQRNRRYYYRFGRWPHQRMGSR